MNIKVIGYVTFQDQADTYEYSFSTMQEAIDYHRSSMITMAETIADFDGGFQSSITQDGKVIKRQSIKTESND